MSAERHTRNMLLRLMAMLHDLAPAELAKALMRFGFRPGDVTFRRGKAKPHRVLTTVRRWPWERTP